MIEIERIPNAVYFPWVSVSSTRDVKSGDVLSVTITAFFVCRTEAGWKIFTQAFGAGRNYPYEELRYRAQEPHCSGYVPFPSVPEAMQFIESMKFGMDYSNGKERSIVEWRPLPESKTPH